MAIHVFSNNIPAQYREPVQKAVVEAMGKPAGDWRLQIHENQMTPGWIVTIWDLSNDSKWSHEFFGIEEQNPNDDFAFIRKTVAAQFPN
jgi:hypothetical protein